MRALKKRVVTAVLAMIFLLSCTVFVFADTAVVTTSDGGSVNMRAEASTDSDVVNFLDDGTEVEVLGTSGDWTQVSYDGYTGYVMSSYLTSSDSSEDTQAEDTSADTAAEDTAAEDTTAEDTASEDTAADTVSEDTDTAAAAEAETSDADEDETDDSTSEQLAKYKKLVMILGLVCLILVIIIINLLLFYRRGYYDDDDDYDDEDDDYDDEDDDDRHVTAEPEYEPIRVPQETREIEVPDISSLVEESTAEALKEKEMPKDGAEASDSDDLELEFFDLDDL